jgi:hypothetical protein
MSAKAHQAHSLNLSVTRARIRDSDIANMCFMCLNQQNDGSVGGS